MRVDRPDPQQRQFPLATTGERANVGAMSGPPLERVRAAWFLPVFDAERAHWYDVAREESGAPRLRRLCDGRLHWPAELFEPGNWPSCLHCRRMIARGAK